MSDYVNKIAPEHSRTSCDDDDLYNAAYGLDDFDGRGRCYRCTLLMAQAKARIEDAAAPATAGSYGCGQTRRSSYPTEVRIAR